MTPIQMKAATLLVAFFLSGCDSGRKWKSGRYEIYWIGFSSDLTLGINIEAGSHIGRVMPQVISVGEDARWIVAARHPNGDKSKTEYYYFPKAEDDPYKNAEDIVQGPFTETEFKQKTQELTLPPLTIHF